jgi:predicted MFS family arabinose efflux permease
MVLRVPSSLRPSVMTVNVMLFGLAQPIGVFAVGPVLDAFGPQPVLVAFAAVQTVAMSLVAAASFAVRRRERTPARVQRVAA